MLQITFDYWSLCFLNVLNNFLFISGCAGSPLLCELLSGCRKQPPGHRLQWTRLPGSRAQAQSPCGLWGLPGQGWNPVACGVFPIRAGTLWPVGSSRSGLEPCGLWGLPGQGWNPVACGVFPDQGWNPVACGVFLIRAGTLWPVGSSRSGLEPCDLWGLPGQGWNPCLLCWQVDSLLLSHQGSLAL